MGVEEIAQATITTEFSYSDWISISGVVIAFFALLRPELTSLFRKFTSKIDFYPSKLIEIGFFDFGPTIGIPFSLRTRGGNQMISEIKLVLTRKRDQATYNFQWGLFREMSAIMKSNALAEEQTKVELANAFLLNANISKNLNIQFHDTDTKERFAESVLKLKNSYDTFINRNEIRISTADDITTTQALFKNEPTQNQLVLDAFGIAGREMYWEDGAYNLKVVVCTDNPQKEFQFNYAFSLTTQQVEQIKLNVIGLTLAAMGTSFMPNFSYSKLKLIKNASA